MKSDLQRIMEKKGIDAVWISGSAQHNPFMTYFTGLVHLTRCDLIIRRNSEAILFHLDMERGEAEKTGFQTVSYSAFPLKDLTGRGISLAEANLIRYKQIFQKYELTSGKILVCGLGDIGQGYSILSALHKAYPHIHFITGNEENILLEIMATKSANEISRIKNTGQKTVEVVGRTAEFLSSHRVKDNFLVKQDGSYLTTGEVKSKINLWLAESGLENPEGVIFACGTESAIPHSTGSDAARIPCGTTIVFDIFPCEAGGGYFSDMTRTWCLGYATEKIEKKYNQVLEVFEAVKQKARQGAGPKQTHITACNYFKSFGYKTLLDDTAPLDGFVHSLGHGVGFFIHEKPRLSNVLEAEEKFLPGMVFTVEPGIYFPDEHMGIRLENTLAVLEDGSIEELTVYPMDLVLPVKI